MVRELLTLRLIRILTFSLLGFGVLQFGPTHSSVPPQRVGCFYPIMGGSSAGYSPADTTPFYFGLIVTPAGQPTTTAPTGPSITTALVKAPTTITDIYFGIVVAGTLGTTETGTVSILVNNTTNNIPTPFNNTIQWNAVTQSYNATGLSIKLNAGDFFTAKVAPPAWATNPTLTFYEMNAYCTQP